MVKFLEGNRVSMDLHFGCTLYVYEKEGPKNEIEQLFEVFAAVQTDVNDPAWKTFRSFFASVSGYVDFDFSEDAKQ